MFCHSSLQKLVLRSSWSTIQQSVTLMHFWRRRFNMAIWSLDQRYIRLVMMDYAYGFSLSEMDKYFKIKNNVIIQWQTLQTVTQYSHRLSSFCFCIRNCYNAKHQGSSPSYLHYNYVNYSSLVMLLYVDDKEVMDNFHEDINRLIADIQFTRRIKENG